MDYENRDPVLDVTDEEIDNASDEQIKAWADDIIDNHMDTTGRMPEEIEEFVDGNHYGRLGEAILDRFLCEGRFFNV